MKKVRFEVERVKHMQCGYIKARTTKHLCHLCSPRCSWTLKSGSFTVACLANWIACRFVWEDGICLERHQAAWCNVPLPERSFNPLFRWRMLGWRINWCNCWHHLHMPWAMHIKKIVIPISYARNAIDRFKLQRPSVKSLLFFDRHFQHQIPFPTSTPCAKPRIHLHATTPIQFAIEVLSRKLWWPRGASGRDLWASQNLVLVSSANLFEVNSSGKEPFSVDFSSKMRGYKSDLDIQTLVRLKTNIPSISNLEQLLVSTTSPNFCDKTPHCGWSAQDEDVLMAWRWRDVRP